VVFLELHKKDFYLLKSINYQSDVEECVEQVFIRGLRNACINYDTVNYYHDGK